MASAGTGQVRLAEHYIQVIPIVGNMAQQLAAQVTQGITSPQVTQAVQHAGSQVGNQLGNQVGNTAGQAAGDGMTKKIMGALAGAAAGGMIAAKVGETVTAALERMDATAKVTAQLNLNPDEAKKVKNAAEAVFNAGYGEDFAGVSEIMKNLVGGVKGAREMSSAELAQLGKDMTNVVTGFDQDSEMVGQALNSMIGNGMVKDASEGLAVLTAGFQQLGPSGADWAESMMEFSDDFATLGYDGAESVGLVKAAIAAGIKDSDSLVDGLNEIQIKIGDFSADEGLMGIGLDPNTVRKNMAAGGDEAQKQFKDIITRLQKSGDRNLWASIIGTKSEDYFNAWQKMDINGAGITGDLKKLDTDLTTINSLVLSMKRTFESAFIKTLQPAIDYVAPKIAEFANYIQNNEEAAKMLGAAIIGTLVVGVVLLTASFFALIVPILANPLTWIIAAWIVGIGLVIAAVWWLVANWDGVTKTMTDIWNGFTGWFTTAIDGMGAGMTDLGRGIGNFFIGLINGLIDMVNTLINALNGIKFKAPDWLGGMEFGGLGIPTVAKVTPMKEGGYVAARPGGTLALLAEAGKSEAVTGATQLNNNLDAQTALMNAMANNGGKTEINIYQLPGESPEELAMRIDEVNRFKATR